MKQYNLVTPEARERARMAPAPDPRSIIREFPVDNRARQVVSETVRDDWRVREGLWQLQNYDPATYRHVVQTGLIAVHIGERTKLTNEQLHILAKGAVLHDLGKTAIDIDIIAPKPGAAATISLETRERDARFAAIKQHPETGYWATRNLYHDEPDQRTKRLVPQLVLTHHCYNDARPAYPDANAMRWIQMEAGLTASDLSDPELRWMGEVLAVSDVYEAISAGRTYAVHEGFEDPRRVEAVLQEAHPTMEEEIDELMAIHSLRFALAEAA